MIEIAIALAVIGFALVAIIGILPTGLNVQRDTRERTVINQDAMYFMNALKSSALELDDLTNFVEEIAIEEPAGTTNYFTYGSGYDNGAEVVGLLTRSNNVATAIVRAISSTAVERGGAGSELAFRYRMEVAMTPAFSVRLDHEAYDALQSRLHEIRLEFRWPARPNGTVGNNQTVYRGMASGWITNTNTPPGPGYYYILK